MQPEHCSNGVQDEDETDLDCGGGCGASCEARQFCSDSDDCATGVCHETALFCVAMHCASGSADGDESDVDCGGSCLGCDAGLACDGPDDCLNGVCGVNGLCLPVTCTDGSQNEDETDLDCGGETCDPCFPEQMCNTADDCIESVCDDGICAFPRCDDGVLNGLETAVDCDGDCLPCSCQNEVMDNDEVDVDCGGSCDGCDIGQNCNTFDDCASAVCSQVFGCIPETCADLERNGDETDVDCGGSCDRCGADFMCGDDDDCDSRDCDGGICAAPRCDDGFQNGDEEGIDCGGSCALACSCIDETMNGDETDVDCGGSCAPCDDGAACGVPGDCASEICLGGSCRPETCRDGMMNDGETDVDCGGPCAVCADGAMCGDADDCRSGVCSGSTCAAASCDDGVQNGFEGDVDCGGDCAPCSDGQGCVVDTDCESINCEAGTCRSLSCDDGIQNGDETAVDCGGSCGSCFPAHCDSGSMDGDEIAADCGGSCLGCAAGVACTDNADCASGLCTGDVCTAPTCADGARADTEGDVDCGGSCPACTGGASCTEDDQCATGRCVSGTCLGGPLASFTLSRDGATGLDVVATSHARAGESPIAQVLFDFGDGFGADAIGTYTSAGVYTVRQRVRDEAGVQSDATLRVRVRDFDPRIERASATDTVLLGRDDLSFSLTDSFAAGSARSIETIEPGTGVFYMEAEWFGPAGAFGFGIATEAHTLGSFIGGDGQSLGVDAGGSVTYNGSYQGGSRVRGTHSAMVIDYRGASPIVHVWHDLMEPPTSVMMTSVTTAIHFVVGGGRTAIGELMRLNVGRDRTNFPFHYNPAAVLAANSITAPGLQLGFGGQGALPADAAPTIAADASASTTLGTPVDLSAIANDAEDGNISHSIEWQNLSATFNDRQAWYGPNLRFDPPTIGLHRIRLRVYDSAGQLAERVIRVQVSGELEQFETVRFIEEETTGEGIVIDDEGLRVRFTAFKKAGIRANQAIIDGFHYFEARREGDSTAQGVGIVTPFGDLDPYAQRIVPWSCSAQVLGGLWRNFILTDEWSTGERDVGIAVDYRGEYPIVYFIVANEVALELHMEEITVPVHPMLYGQPPAFSGWQWRGNFGETEFGNDPVAALTAHGVDASELQQSWGR